MECLCPPCLWNPTPCLLSLYPTLSHPSISLSRSSPVNLCRLTPSPSFSPDPFERVSHENCIFDWPHQYVSLSIWCFSLDFLEGLSFHSFCFVFTKIGFSFLSLFSGASHLQHKLLHSWPKKQMKQIRRCGGGIRGVERRVGTAVSLGRKALDDGCS